MIPYLDETAPDAAIIGAVNTVRREGDKLIGENTDGKGFLCGDAVQTRGVDPKGKLVAGRRWARAARRARLSLNWRWPALRMCW